NEVDGNVWTIPGARTKTRKEHRVPLSAGVLAVLKQQASVRANEFVFPGERRHSLHDRAMQALLQRMGMACSGHGMRSTLGDWAAETTPHPNHVVEMALAHKVGNAVEAAYRRGDLFEKRWALMNDWARYCESTPVEQGKVVPLRSTA